VITEGDVLWAWVEQQFEDGVSVLAISRQTGIPRGTIYNHLTREGLHVPTPGRRGPAPKDECAQGHDMAEWGRPAPSRGGRFCLKCRRKRDRERKKRDYHAAKTEALPPAAV
jgi:hypothetical protein